MIVENKANSVDMMHLIRHLNEVFAKVGGHNFAGFEDNQYLTHLVADESSILDKSTISMGDSETSPNSKGFSQQ
jgi:hypothetical protein